MEAPNSLRPDGSQSQRAIRCRVDEKRIELLGRLNELPGVDLPEDAIRRRPSISLVPILCKIIFLVKLSLPITAVTRLADAGADPFVIAEILGHSDLRMTEGYTHATDQRKREALERLALYDKKLKSRSLLSRFATRLSQ